MRRDGSSTTVARNSLTYGCGRITDKFFDRHYPQCHDAGELCEDKRGNPDVQPCVVPAGYA
jgi:hypothetical protein